MIDAAFDIIRTDPDPATRRQRRRGSQQAVRLAGLEPLADVDLWGIVQRPYVNGVPENLLPDRTEGIGLAFLGLHNMNQLSCATGECR